MVKLRPLFLYVGGLVALCSMLLIHGPAEAMETEDGKITLNGFVKNWTGYRWGSYGDERGEGLSMFRNSLQLEGEVRFTEKTSLYTIFRGTKEAAYDLEKEAVDLGNFDDNDLNEAEFREYYLQSQITPRVWTAVGRQQVVWGDVSGFRVMDIINPLDLRWHFSLENWEDIRIPLNMLNTIVSIPEANGNVQFVWVPGIDEPYNRVNRAFGNPGHRWGVNNVPAGSLFGPPQYVTPDGSRYNGGETVDWKPDTVVAALEDAEADPPGVTEGDLEDGDVGLRWQQTVGGINYGLLAYYGHDHSPSLWWEGNPLLGDPVNLKHERQLVLGTSWNWYDNFTDGVFRGEAGYFPDKAYTADKRLLIDGVPNPDFYNKAEEDTIKFALGYDRNFTFVWLDPQRSVITQFQLIGTYIPGAEDLIVPGYNTEIKEFDLIATLFLNWGWDLDHWTVNLYPAWNIDREWGMVQAWLDYKPRWMNGLTITPKVNYFFGDDPWTGDFALVRGNSEALLEVKYEF